MMKITLGHQPGKLVVQGGDLGLEAEAEVAVVCAASTTITVTTCVFAHNLDLHDVFGQKDHRSLCRLAVGSDQCQHICCARMSLTICEVPWEKGMRTDGNQLWDLPLTCCCFFMQGLGASVVAVGLVGRHEVIVVVMWRPPKRASYHTP